MVWFFKKQPFPKTCLRPAHIKPLHIVKSTNQMFSSLWQAENGQYQDAILNRDGKYNEVVYDFPKKRTDRNHLVNKDALYFVKTKIPTATQKPGEMKLRSGWVFVGIVSEVIATGIYPGTEQKFAQLKIRKMPNTYAFKNKNVALKELGFNELGDNERMHGLIPIYKSS